MPRPFSIIIDNIFGGISPSMYFGAKGSYHASIGIDPDMPVDDSSVRTSGFIRPTSMSKISGATVTDAPMWMVTTPKTSTIYVYARDGKVHRMNSSLAFLSDAGTLASSTANGAEYYDNYAYFAKNTDIDRYGPLDGSPSFTTGYWNGTLGKAALSNTTYPSIQGIPIPNHPMHRHTDNKLYIGDVLSNTTANTNKGALHYVRTTKTSVEGDTDNGSSYNALDLGYGYYPTAIESYGTDLAVALIEGVSTSVKQKPAAIAFWDATSSSFQKIIQVEFPDPLITALKNVNGILYVWSGSASGGVRLSRFVGGYSFQDVWYSEDGYPPFQGAVDGEMNRVVWGGATSYPEASASVFAYGSKNAALGQSVHNVFRTTSSGGTQMVTCLKYLEQSGGSRKRPVAGWHDASSQGVDAISTTYGTSVWRSAVYRMTEPFVINRVYIPMGQPVAANMTVTPKIFIDNATSSKTLKVLNSSNFPNSDMYYFDYPAVNGTANFFLELRWTGTALCTVAFPITIEGEYRDS